MPIGHFPYMYPECSIFIKIKLKNTIKIYSIIHVFILQYIIIIIIIISGSIFQ